MLTLKRLKERNRRARLRRRFNREFVRELIRVWHRSGVSRILGVLLGAWLVGSIGIYLAERGRNEAFGTWTESLWSVGVLLFSGMELQPESALGRLFALLVVLSGLGFVSVFTASMASVLVHTLLGRRDVSNFELEDHLVLCNWAPRGLNWIREVHSKIIQDKRPVVIIHDDPDSIALPDNTEDASLQDVFIVPGDPTNEIILRRAGIIRAHSVVVLSDDRQGEHADGKTILTCIAIHNVCKGPDRPNVAVECRNPNFRFHLKKAGADEIISSDELGLRLLARSALYHGMTHVYQELLTIGRDANELYVMPLPAELVGRDFVEVSSMFLRHRNDRRSCLLIGLQRGDDMILNPVGDEAGPLREGDELILLSRVFLGASQVLPTVPPITQAASHKVEKG